MTLISAFMSDRQLARLASDPIASIKYGDAIKDFRSIEKSSRFEQKSRSVIVDDSNLDRIEKRLRRREFEEEDEDEIPAKENYFDQMAIKEREKLREVLELPYFKIEYLAGPRKTVSARGFVS